MPEPLAGRLDLLAADLRAARQLLFFSDFDGTLVPTQDRPTECFLDPAVAQTLSALAGQDRVAVGIVSGRELDDLRARVGLGGIAYVGNHGLEIEGPDFSFREPTAASRISELDQMAGDAARAIQAIPGAWVEHKRLSASVHYRQVEPAEVPLVLAAVRRVASQAVVARRFALRCGKAVLEIRPDVGWNKGTAVRWLAKRMSSSSNEPLLTYLGDDDTDEDVFVAWPGGITVCVGEKHATAAKYSVRDHKEVHEIMEWFLEVVAGWQRGGATRARQTPRSP